MVNKRKLSIMIVEDTKAELYLYESFLKALGHETETTDSHFEALDFIRRRDYDVLLTDIHLVDQDDSHGRREGIELMRKVKEICPNMTMIAMSNDPKVEVFDAAVAAGALHFIRKPIERVDEIAIALSQALRRKTLEVAAKHVTNPPRIPSSLSDRASDGVLCSLKERKTLLGMAKHKDVALVIYGETGTGKEEMAKIVHRERCRLDGVVPLVTVNCANLTPTLAVSELFGHRAGSFSGAKDTTNGLIGAADGGILFLDEIQALPLECQRMLLRVFQDKKYTRLGDTRLLFSDFQLIVASTKNLDDEVEAGRMLLDLRTRVTGMELRLAPLRERLGEISDLLALFFARSDVQVEEPHLSRLIAACTGYYWQGNIRQLYQTLSMMVVNFKVNGTPIRAETMPDFKSMRAPFDKSEVSEPDGLLGAGLLILEQALAEDIPLERTMDALEKIVLTASLRRHRSISGVHKALDIARSTLDSKRSKHGLKDGQC